MAFAKIGVDIQITGVGEALRQLSALNAGIKQVVDTAKQLKTGLKLPTRLNINQQQGGIQIIDQKALDLSQKFTKTIDNSIRSVTNMGKETTKASRAVTLFNTVQKNTRTILGGVTRSLDNAVKGVEIFARRLTSFGSVISTVGIRMTAVFAPFVAGFGGAVRSAAEFDRKITQLVTTVGLSGREVEKMREGILNLSRELGRSPIELVAGQYAITSREVRDTALSLGVLELAGKGAAIGLGETQEIAELLASQLVITGGGIEEATKTMDILLGAVQHGALEADELVGPLGRVLGTAVNLGIGMDELTAFISTFALSNVSASEAVTGLTGIMRVMLKPAKETRDIFAAIFQTNDGWEGVARAQERLKEVGLAQFLKEMSLAAEELDLPLSQIFTRFQGLNAALFTSQAAWEEYQIILNNIQNSAGSTEQAFRIVQQSSAFQFDRLKSNLQATAIVIGDALLPALNLIVEKITPFVAAIATLAKQHPNIILMAAAFVALLAVLGPLVFVTGLLLSSFGAIVSFFASIAGLITGALLSPLSLVITAIAAAGGLILLMFGVTLPGRIKEGLQTITGDMTTFRDKNGKAMTSWSDRALEWGANLVIQFARGIAEGAVYVINELNKLGQFIVGLLKGASPPPLLPDLPDYGRNVMQEFLRGFTLADFGVFDEIKGVISGFFKSLPENIVDKGALAGLIIGSQSALAQAIAEVKTLGSVTQETLAKISGSFGRTSIDIQNYVNTMLELAAASKAVADAEAEIEQINKNFAASVKPLNDELKEIDDRFQEVKEQQERERLESILTDRRAPALAKELARLSLRRLDIEGQIRAEEEKRDAALVVAEQKLEIAKSQQTALQEQADLQRALIEHQTELNELLKQEEEIRKAAKQAAEETIASLAGGLDKFGLGGAGGEGDGEPTSLFDTIGGALQEKVQELKDLLGPKLEELKGIFQPVLDALAGLQETWTTVFDLLEERGITIGDITKFLVGMWFVMTLIKTIGFGNVITIITGALKLLLIPLRLVAILFGAIGLPMLLVIGLGILLGVVIYNTAQRFGGFGKWMEYVIETARKLWILLKIGLVNALLMISNKLRDFLIPKIEEAWKWMLTLYLQLEDIKKLLQEKLIGAIGSLATKIKDKLVSALESATEWLGKVWGWLSDIADKLSSIDWFPLLGDSPSPFELSLRDIVKAANQVTEAVTGISASANIVSAPAAAGVVNQNTSSNQFSFGPVYITSDMDQAVFEARVRKVVSEMVRV